MATDSEHARHDVGQLEVEHSQCPVLGYEPLFCWDVFGKESHQVRHIFVWVDIGENTINVLYIHPIDSFRKILPNLGSWTQIRTQDLF